VIPIDTSEIDAREEKKRKGRRGKRIGNGRRKSRTVKPKKIVRKEK
jgi:hypothetical protein